MTIGTLTLADFLLARIAEDEAAAQEAALTVGWDGFGDQRIRSGQHWVESYHIVKRVRDEGPTDRRTVADCGAFVGMGTAPHIARWDPARVLAKCEAERRIVTAYTAPAAWPLELRYLDDDIMTALEWVMKQLALPYADHPDYREEWRP